MSAAVPNATADTARVIRAYYDAFNAGDEVAFLALLTEDVVHDINQGGREVGHEAFARFLARMNACYRERIADLVILTAPDGTRAAAEFTVHGTYLKTDPGLPEAQGQSYVLPAGAFFTLRDGRVARISNYYNLQDWLAQVTRK
ncbi:Isopropylmalate/homocitrate/citramalate synthase [Rhodovastum atsumiense]|uniref:Isopropylmalate/homocitrate/citramalate synthase n=1 Tax=Rhodovastum atsumiense TaxID=504468 RepID=A0A5M6IP01_9PROT|nr:ketosteroid isomerase-related protein [Rhodovastum atsumiense]KAA5609982.1 isopropylmalate/homocitrate/citramalate synthase [Rhodovastum atsumiense]CAH2598623.1 Isopropylmalate/homocitrate/citramalate synthase [Rhodovastum atsumiense]